MADLPNELGPGIAQLSETSGKYLFSLLGTARCAVRAAFSCASTVPSWQGAQCFPPAERGYVLSARAPQGAAVPRVPFASSALVWLQLLECAGRAQRRRRFGFPAFGGVIAWFRRGSCAESKAAWRFASRRTPKMCAACYRSWHNAALGWRIALNTYPRAGTLRCGVPARQLRSDAKPKFREGRRFAIVK
jgi:hypothetical protein